MLYAGVDIAKVDHVIGIVDQAGERACRPMTFENSVAGFERCCEWLSLIASSPRDVVVGMEATGHYWMALFSYLMAHDYQVCVFNPMRVHALRRLKGMSRVKTDRVDSELIAEALRLGDYDETRIATDEIQSLRTLTRYHQTLKQELAQVKTHCLCVLDAYFPEFVGAFSDPFCAGSRAVLSRWPLPSSLARARTATVERELLAASRGRLGRAKAEELRLLARSSVGIRLGEDAAALQVRSLVAQMDFLYGQVGEVVAKSRDLLMMIEPLVLTIPGVSVTTGAQIVAEIGDPSRFRNAAALVSYAGLNPGTSQSGRFEAGSCPITKQGSPYLRRALWLSANRARQCDPSVKAFYERKRDEGKAYRVAVTAVARKLCHVVFAVLRDQVPYESGRFGSAPERAVEKNPA